MKRITVIALSLLISLPLLAGTMKSLPLMDGHCAEKAKDDPGKHKRACAIRCSKGGYGVIKDGAFVKFDEKGNEMALAALKASEKTDNLTVTVRGEMKDGVLHVTDLKLDE